jgi:predicted HicB family RNase H-like nuclease
MEDNRYISTRDERFKMGALMKDGMDERKAFKKAFPGKKDVGTYIARWKAGGVYPFGEIDGPDESQATFLPQLKDTTNTLQDSVSVAQIAIIRDIVRQEVSTALQSNAIQSNSIRPILKRSKKDTSPKTFRCPEKLWQLAEQRAKSQGMSLNGLVETLLFEFVGRPEDLLAERT